MAWRIALILDPNIAWSEVVTLCAYMPVWMCSQTASLPKIAAFQSSSHAHMWEPEPTLTTFPINGTPIEGIAPGMIDTFYDHHPDLSAILVIGVPNSDILTQGMVLKGFVPAKNLFARGIVFRAAQSNPETTLVLDASSWTDENDFYTSFFRAVGAPEWHGRNFDALHDSVVTGHINEIEAPYRVQIVNLSSTETSLKQFLQRMGTLFQSFFEEGCPVVFELGN